ncbi:hypothetical protein COO91_06867 [Nostoc flagelliforme CCNUN1]|uniref:Uncharacterized protein n=1 Tax=Nostoc flagelliforme CCNUN1 TaxID=2038116 RepID=A0A2K8T1G8_9NOSO|nr:hypothetical protein COO91_06867 [Nostoc flagelliforme CCNUN1]
MRAIRFAEVLIHWSTVIICGFYRNVPGVLAAMKSYKVW